MSLVDAPAPLRAAALVLSAWAAALALKPGPAITVAKADATQASPASSAPSPPIAPIALGTRTPARDIPTAPVVRGFDPIAVALEGVAWKENEAMEARPYNEEENAAGPLQIRPIMVDECNRLADLQGLSVRFTLEDRWDAEKSREMFELYSAHWARKHGDWSVEGIVRRWPGGWDGHTQWQTLAYWRDVAPRLRGKIVGAP